MRPVNLDEYEKQALGRLPPMIRDYYAAGADDGVTLRRNREVYAELSLRYRVLVDVSQRSTQATILGQRVAAPVLIAPTAFQRMAHDEGEAATARAAGALDSIMILSTLSTCSIEEVTAAASGPIWFQLYVYRDREATIELIRRAERAGCQALVLTVDAPIWGRREPDIRNGFHLPDGLTVKNLTAAGMEQMPAEAQQSGLNAYISSFLDPSLGWQDLDWLRQQTKLPLIVKGIVRGDDAQRAVDAGCQGVVVSNHGGRQLDTSPATLEALPEVSAAIGGRAEIYLDGGIRRGTDVVKALALGASAVLIGRPVLWGLSVDGQAGVEHVLQLLFDEFSTALGLCGYNSVAEIEREIVRGAID